MKGDVTERACHPDAIRPNECWVLIIFLVGVIALGVPFLPGGVIEVRVWKKAEANHAGRSSIHCEVGAVGSGRDRLIEIKPKLIRLCRLAVTRLVDQSHFLEALWPCAGIASFHKMYQPI